MRNSGKREVNNGVLAVRVFILTLSIVLFAGILGILVIKKINDSTQGGGVKLVSGWEDIPEASTAPNAAVDSEEGAKRAAIIYEGDEDYTHVIAAADDDTVTIGFAGDILFDDNYAVGDAFARAGNTAVGVVGSSLLEKMQGVDIMMVNNEFPYSNGGTPTAGKTYTFRARPETASILNDMGVDIVGLANNHAYDYGEQALLDTFTTVNDAGIVYAGAGKNLDEASHPVYYITDSGMKIAIICATQIERLDNPDTKGATETSAGVFRCFDDSLLLDRVREAREKNAYVIVFIHWGTESTSEVDYLQTDQAKEITDAGANLIIGAHPHVLQKIDYVNGVPVVYSLGNYIFNSKTLDTGMMVATLHKNGSVNLQFVPAIQSGCSVYEAVGDEKMRVLNEMAGMSPGIVLDSNGYISPR
ncbi:poly-gamma-glutamate synthesis protein (capsule biosynthesis protein) [Butyrivibrio hungatei DSM 14810]|uniref:Poly-gamma-glutamate synthesis protein (Capsule biosynthesis protein) n=1 Tax=Butyrivibrio hungatei DSM 14810 TaxID=1121132 RepID=A0A1M7SK05_9FIRM|nr:CapA family protein [Butyrivibrio hungatei]SHN58802.1 poly-gamma-glutamate synthesis protein (capsule biosynthesis protein) [Butyrivibrio hungatei DSM 14810]